MYDFVIFACTKFTTMLKYTLTVFALVGLFSCTPAEDSAEDGATEETAEVTEGTTDESAEVPAQDEDVHYPEHEGTDLSKMDPTERELMGLRAEVKECSRQYDVLSMEYHKLDSMYRASQK
jgi:hypothetical protein